MNRIVFLLLWCFISCTQPSVQRTYPAIAVSPPSLDFGRTAVGATSTLHLNVTSQGSGALHVERFVLESESPSPFAFESFVGDLERGETHAVQVSFSPTVVGVYTARLLIDSNAENAAQILVTLVAQSVPAPADAGTDAGAAEPDSGTSQPPDAGPAPSGLSYASSMVVCWVGAPCAVPSPAVTGDVHSWSVSPSFYPLQLSETGAISGTPSSASETTTYTITASNAGGRTSTTLQLAVHGLASIPSGVDVSHLKELDVAVNGIGLTQYRYKLSADPCTSADGYSEARPLIAHITDSVLSILDETVSLCVLGGDAEGRWQPTVSKCTIKDATEQFKKSPAENPTLIRIVDTDAGSWVSSEPVLVTDGSDAGTLFYATCQGCEVAEVSGSWGPSLSVQNGRSIRLRHFTVASAGGETASKLVWSNGPADTWLGGTWRFFTLNKGATCAPGSKRVFFTKTRFTGDLGGLTGANAKCQAEATDAGYGASSWVAVLGVQGNNPAAKFTVSPYCSMEGREVVRDGAFVAPLLHDVRGTRLNTGDSSAVYLPIKPREPYLYWWGGSDDCAAWTSTTTTLRGRYSESAPTDPSWGWFLLQTGGSGITNCSRSMGLLCVER